MADKTIAELKEQCHHLIESVSRRPGGLKLLLGVRNQLLLFNQYKQGRLLQFSKRNPQKPDYWSD